MSSDWEIAAIAVKCCRNVRIEDNHIKKGRQKQFLFEPNTVFDIQNSSDISILDTRVDDRREGYDYYDITNTSAMGIKGNTDHGKPADMQQ